VLREKYPSRAQCDACSVAPAALTWVPAGLCRPLAPPAPNNTTGCFSGLRLCTTTPVATVQRLLCPRSDVCGNVCGVTSSPTMLPSGWTGCDANGSRKSCFPPNADQLCVFVALLGKPPTPAPKPLPTLAPTPRPRPAPLGTTPTPPNRIPTGTPVPVAKTAPWRQRRSQIPSRAGTRTLVAANEALVQCGACYYDQANALSNFRLTCNAATGTVTLKTSSADGDLCAAPVELCAFAFGPFDGLRAAFGLARVGRAKRRLATGARAAGDSVRRPSRRAVAGKRLPRWRQPHTPHSNRPESLVKDKVEAESELKFG